MDPQEKGLDRVLDAIDSLRSELARLEARVAAVEDASAAAAGSSPQLGAEAAAASTSVNGDLAIAIAAAVAAYLGKRPHIRQIRLLGSSAWAQQGRVSVQGSYSVSVNPR
jgi:methylmalonyl-CoA carboxyltransferase 12S subunit